MFLLSFKNWLKEGVSNKGDNNTWITKSVLFSVNLFYFLEFWYCPFRV